MTRSYDTVAAFEKALKYKQAVFELAQPEGTGEIATLVVVTPAGEATAPWHDLPEHSARR